MSSDRGVNYGLRPSKIIQRNIVFEGAKSLLAQLELSNLVYVGFGSIWFIDFILAHRQLGISDMYSIESNEIVYKRALFNKPYRTVSVQHGTSAEVLPNLLESEELKCRPWFVWLDYTSSVTEDVIDDVRMALERLPPNSLFVLTLNASGGAIAQKPIDRPQRLRSLFGSVVPDTLTESDCQDALVPQTLLDLMQDYMVSVAVDVGRPGRYVPAFRIRYRDTAQMVTVGGFLPKPGAVSTVETILKTRDWPGFPRLPIDAPHLTLKEKASLQAELPQEGAFTRGAIQALGFDLREPEIEAFQAYYKYYPAFAQIYD